MTLSRLGRRAVRTLLLLAAIGLAVRVAVAFATYGNRFDVGSYYVLRLALREYGLDVYGAVNVVQRFSEIEVGRRWPYPPAFFAWIEASNQLTFTGLPFHGFIQIPAILADIAIAVLVQDFLGRRGFSERARVVAAALVILGPAFAITSGWHGQIDSLAVLPAVAAVWLWDLPDWKDRGTALGRHPGARALSVGLLIGAGAATKSVPIVALLVFAGVLRSRREAVVLVASGVAVPALLLTPFLIADGEGVRESLAYSGLPGAGGLSLVVQPGLATSWIEGPLTGISLSGASQLLRDWGGPLLGVALIVTALFVRRYRVPPASASALIWLVVMTLSSGFFPHYTVWALPFLLMAGMLRTALAAQALVLVAVPVVYWVNVPGEVEIYVIAMLFLWLLFALATLRLGREVVGLTRTA